MMVIYLFCLSSSFNTAVNVAKTQTSWASRCASLSTLKKNSHRSVPGYTPKGFLHPNIVTTSNKTERKKAELKSSLLIKAMMIERDKFIWGSIGDNSQKNYRSGYNRWCAFVKEIGTDVTMSIIPPAWTRVYTHPLVIHHPWKECCVTLFLSWLRRTGSMVIPRTAFGYLSAVRYFLLNNGIDVSFLESQYVKSTKAGMQKQWEVLPGNSKEERKNIPIAIHMIMTTKRSYKLPLSTRNLAMYTAMILAYVTSQRYSNILPRTTESWTHAVLSQDIIFVIQESNGDMKGLASYQHIKVHFDKVVSRCLDYHM